MGVTAWDHGSVSLELEAMANSIRATLAERWGPAPHVRRTIESPGESFPAAPNEFFRWVATCVVIDRRGRVLQIRESRFDTDWKLPGGAAIPNERPSETARREVLEVTGIDCDVTGLLGTELLDVVCRDGSPAPVIRPVFVAEWPRETPRTAEGDACISTWTPVDDLPESLPFSDEIRTLRPGD